MILYAPNINSGGGLVLLNTVIQEEVFGKVTHLFIDERCPLEFDVNVVKVKPSLYARIKTEFRLRKIALQNPNEQIVCFGNLPPIFKHKNFTTVFLQNAYLLKDIKLPNSFKFKLRIIYERIIFYSFIKNTDLVIVQTKWMRDALQNYLNKVIKIVKILPQFPKLNLEIINNKIYDFIIITGPEYHKNSHLIEEVFNKFKVNIDLCLIGNVNVNIKNQYVTVTHKKHATRNELYNFLNKSKSIIILSEFESFCLPLYEANHFQLNIIAPNKEYVNDSNIKYIEIDLHNIDNFINTLHHIIKCS